ncbi:Wzz/FepE/Etk N-terminal domain-containing protein [Paracoccus shanxieyensis]|uniref:Wzz/FepE/Etk N-terminal domain-containing protein n=1 Tax=Paracoccus shanxieyensis TaxID=2675752 RepID=UPI0018ACA1A7
MPEVDLASTLRAITSGLRRRWRLIAGTTLLMSLLALAYVLTATPQYTARAALVIDPRISNSPNGVEAPTLLLSDALLVDSEIKVLGSRDVTSRVAQSLGLYDMEPEPESVSLPRMVLNGIGALLGSGSEPPTFADAEAAEATRRETIRQKMMEGFDISRDGGTYVIDIAYTSEDPMFATRAVNSMVDEYFKAASDAALSDTRRIHGWLDQRVQVLGQEVQTADAAVAQYRQANDLFAMRDGNLPSEVELSNANDLLIRLRQELIETQTRQDKIKAIVASQSTGALLDGTLGGEVASPALRDFQTRYSGLVAEETDLVTRWGANSDMVNRNRSDQARLREAMMQEAGQIVERLDTQIITVRRQITATEQHVEELRDRSNSDAQKSIQLNVLEREADAKRGLYQSMLNELNTSAQRETFQRSPARVIGQAVPPDEKSSPKGMRTLILAIFGGLVIGSALAFLREVMDNRLLRISDVREGLGLRYLGMLPGVRSSYSVKPSGLMQPARGDGVQRVLRGLAAELQQRRPERGALVTGVVSCRRGEGRAQTAGWLSAELAGHDARVALISIVPEHARLFAGQPGHMALPALNQIGDVAQLSGRIAQLAQAGRPAVVSMAEGVTADLLSPAQFQALAGVLQGLREKVDHVVLILPAISDLSEAEIASGLVDGAIISLRWGQERAPEIAETLGASRVLRPMLLGGLFTANTARGFSRYN